MTVADSVPLARTSPDPKDLAPSRAVEQLDSGGWSDRRRP